MPNPTTSKSKPKSKQPSEADILRNRSSIKQAEYQRLARRILHGSSSANTNPNVDGLQEVPEVQTTLGGNGGSEINVQSPQDTNKTQESQYDQEETWSEGEDEFSGVGLPNLKAESKTETRPNSTVGLITGRNQKPKTMSNELLRRRLLGNNQRNVVPGNGVGGYGTRHGGSKPMPMLHPSWKSAADKSLGNDGVDGNEEEDEEESRGNLTRHKGGMRSKSKSKSKSESVGGQLDSSSSVKPDTTLTKGIGPLEKESGIAVAGAVDGELTAIKQKKRPMTFLDQVLAEKEKKRKKKRKNEGS